MSFRSCATPFINNGLRTADTFPVVASLPPIDRKCVCCSQATPFQSHRTRVQPSLESKTSFIASHCISFSTLSVATQERLQSLHERVSHRKAFDSWKIGFSAQTSVDDFFRKTLHSRTYISLDRVTRSILSGLSQAKYLKGVSERKRVRKRKIF